MSKPFRVAPGARTQISLYIIVQCNTADFDPRRDALALQAIADGAEQAADNSDLDTTQTDQAKMSGELLTKLRSHPEVVRAGVHIGFAEIQEWKIDERFMTSSKDIAMRLQETHAITERKRMELTQHSRMYSEQALIDDAVFTFRFLTRT
jgi:hypothetical protein